MRLRQIALASLRLDDVARQLNRVFGLKVAYVDPKVGRYGLRNVVMPCGDGFLEICEPTTTDASIARFLARRGDAGYMIILQTADARAEQDRVAQMGVRVVETIDRPVYYCAHFHPADFGGVLVSFDQQRTTDDHLAAFGDWMPAGPEWRAARTQDVGDMASVTVGSGDAYAMARHWSDLLGRPLDAADDRSIRLDKGAIRFADAASVSITAIDMKMRDPARALRSAREIGLDVSDDGVLIAGVRFRPKM
ncbi:MAG: VOC family protein [Hyphomicrobiales bacterium]|nr:VOC family protein [Hyphomicrobiales bacterium]